MSLRLIHRHTSSPPYVPKLRLASIKCAWKSGEGSNIDVKALLSGAHARKGAGPAELESGGYMRSAPPVTQPPIGGERQE